MHFKDNAVNLPVISAGLTEISLQLDRTCISTQKLTVWMLEDSNQNES